MSVHKDDSTNTWRVVYRYTDYTGKNKQSQKRGFATKREALAWERENASKLETKLDMTFASFVEIYTEDMKKRVKENTWKTKEHIIETKILPYFKKRKIGEILPKDILAWQNKMLSSEDKSGKPFSPSYLKTIHNQLTIEFCGDVFWIPKGIELYDIIANWSSTAVREAGGLRACFEFPEFTPELRSKYLVFTRKKFTHH